MGTAPAQQCPGPGAHRQCLPSRSHRLAGQCCALALPGTRGKAHSKASARHSHAGEKPEPPGDSQELSAGPQGCFGSSLQIELLLDWGACPRSSGFRMEMALAQRAHANRLKGLSGRTSRRPVCSPAFGLPPELACPKLPLSLCLSCSAGDSTRSLAELCRWVSFCLLTSADLS